MSKGLIAIMGPIQEEYASSTEWQEINAKAYPPPVVEKKVKKVKDKGSRFPGANKQQELPVHPKE